MSNRGFNAIEARFYTEAIQNENKQRIEWFLKYGGVKVQVEEESRNKVKKPKRKLRSGPHPKVLKVRDSGEPISLNPMRPVPEEVRKLLYNGISHNGEGRYRYLWERYKKSPKEKYYFQESKNWEYGWGVESIDPEMYLDAERYGRAGIIQESFYRRCGVANDPEYYKAPVNANAPISLPIL